MIKSISPIINNDKRDASCLLQTVRYKLAASRLFVGGLLR